MKYGVYAHSHWQGAGPDRQIAHGTRESAEAAADVLTTCSFCAPGRTGAYQVGRCYVVAPTRRPRGVKLPDDAADWSRADLLDLLSEE